MIGHIRARAGRHHQLAVGGLDVRETVDVELEDLRGVLHAQPIAGAEILINPHPKRLARHGSRSLSAPYKSASNAQISAKTLDARPQTRTLDVSRPPRRPLRRRRLRRRKSP